MVQLASAECDPGLDAQLADEALALTGLLDEVAIRLTLSGAHDHHSAIVTIRAGAGGTEAQDWAQMLLGMYAAWAASGGRTAEIMDVHHADGPGIRTATIAVGGDHAYGLLATEHGVHRLVRNSPYDPANKRHTSFASVDVMPDIQSTVQTGIRPEELKMDTFRASGPGGQNVQKVASAVRITHLPTGTVVSCQTERSQHQNRESAMRILRARLTLLQEQELAARLAAASGQKTNPEWGHHIRSYFLHPQRLVKDHQTGAASTNPAAVLQGQIHPFIQARLMQQPTLQG